MFAKPHSAKVAIVNDVGSSAAFCAPSMVKATSSFSTMRVPSRLPISMQSCHGTPMIHAIGAKTQPKSVSRLAGTNESVRSQQIMRAAKYPVDQRNQREEISIAATLIASPSPSLVPFDAAASTFSCFSSSMIGSDRRPASAESPSPAPASWPAGWSRAPS